MLCLPVVLHDIVARRLRLIGEHRQDLVRGMTAMQRPTYVSAPHLTSPSALDDQQLAGSITWIPGGLVYAIAVLGLLSPALRAERQNELPAAAQVDSPSLARDQSVSLVYAQTPRHAFAASTDTSRQNRM